MTHERSTVASYYDRIWYLGHPLDLLAAGSARSGVWCQLAGAIVRDGDGLEDFSGRIGIRVHDGASRGLRERPVTRKESCDIIVRHCARAASSLQVSVLRNPRRSYWYM